MQCRHQLQRLWPLLRGKGATFCTHQISSWKNYIYLWNMRHQISAQVRRFLLCYLSSIILVYFCDYFRVALRRHSSKMHKERAGGIPCRRCNIHVSKTAHEGNLHVKECRERFTFDCNECDAKLQTPSHLKTHKELYHDEPKYDCNFCEKKFKRK